MKKRNVEDSRCDAMAMNKYMGIKQGEKAENDEGDERSCSVWRDGEINGYFRSR